MSPFILHFFVVLPLILSVQSQIDTTDCGVSYGCFRTPTSCQNTNCDYVVKWKDKGSKTEFIIGSKAMQSNFYLAIAFSYDRKMGDDCVVMCKYSTDSSRSIEHYYNPRKEKTSEVLDPKNPTIGLTESNITLLDNYLTCSFKREKYVQISNEYFDLNNPYFLLIVKGYLDPDNEPTDHKKNKLSSSDQIDFRSINNGLITFSQFNLTKIHGILMITTWIFFATFGIIFARYYKYLGANGNILGVQPWFAFHRTLMFTVPILSILGLLIILNANQWSWVEPGLTLNFAHSIVGILAIGFSTINPIYAVLRPAKDAYNRPLFNWIHRLLGFLIYTLALASILLGSLIFFNNPKWTLFCGWFGWLILYIFLLEIIDYRIKSSEEEPLLSNYRNLDSNRSNNTLFNKRFKTFLLTVHLIISIVLLGFMNFFVAIESQN